MSSPLIDNLRAQIGGPRDGAMLRLALADALLSAGERGPAIAALRDALDFDAGYSAAWKRLGKALAESGDTDGAIQAYEQGIEAATRRGDRQAEKEMQVFLRRLRREN